MLRADDYHYYVLLGILMIWLPVYDSRSDSHLKPGPTKLVGPYFVLFRARLRTWTLNYVSYIIIVRVCYNMYDNETRKSSNSSMMGLLIFLKSCVVFEVSSVWLLWRWWNCILHIFEKTRIISRNREYFNQTLCNLLTFSYCFFFYTYNVYSKTADYK